MARLCDQWPRCGCAVRGYRNPAEPSGCGPAPVSVAHAKRRPIPIGVKLIVALRRLGLADPGAAVFDHTPPLALRPIDPLTGDTIPPANDPDHIQLLTVPENREKTYGRGGEKRATVADGDIHKIAKAARMAADRLGRAGFVADARRKMLAKGPDNPAPAKSAWPKRSFPKKPKPPKKGKRR